MGGSRGGGWIGWLATLLQNSSPKNIPKYNTWENIPKYMAPREIEKLPVTISFLAVIFSGKEGTL